VTDGSLLQAALSLEAGWRLAHAAHFCCGPQNEQFAAHLQEARKQLGSGLASLDVIDSQEPVELAVSQAVVRQQHDLVVLGFHHQEDIPLAEQILQAGEHHLLLATHPQSAPSKALICITSGEPGKDDVLFAGRLVRHMSADATLLSVLSPFTDNSYNRERTERFLEGGVDSLSVLGVPARTKIRNGLIAEEINKEVREGGFDLLVLGVPLTGPTRRISFAGVVGQTLGLVGEIATLIVRSHYTG
jgi:sulfate transport system ATP-binding protein